MPLPPPTLADYAAINDLSILELLNEDNDHVLLGPLRVWGGGTVIKGVIQFQRKRHSHYLLRITENDPALPLGNFHLLNSVGAPWYIDSSKISLPEGHQWRSGAFIMIFPLPAFGEVQENPQGPVRWDLRDKDWTYLTLDTNPQNMRMWIDAREP